MTRFAWPPATAEGRWATFGPYYAMFPVTFVRDAVEQLCPAGGAVLDPSCGRGTVPFVASVTGRPALGIDVNAVAYVFSAAKTDPEPELAPVLTRIAELLQPSNHYCRTGVPLRSQTSLFGDRATKPGETDLLSIPRSAPAPDRFLAAGFQPITPGNLAARA